MQNPLWLRRDGTDRPALDRELFSVIHDGVIVGAVHRSHATPLGHAWSWSITCLCRQRGAHNGRTHTKAEALADFRAAWEKADPDIEYERAHHAKMRISHNYKAYCDAHSISLWGLRSEDRPSDEAITRWLDERGIDMPPAKPGTRP
jgi:hypothetical protein